MAPLRPLTLTTRYGSLRGVYRDEVGCYFAVPYARPPIGTLRFRAALPPAPWSGVRDASSPGPIAPQVTSGTGYVPGDPTEQDEDCLSLNIFSAAAEGDRRPVVVFVHGGAFQTGTGAGVMYDGTHLARAGVVVVTLNYRLGALGLLAHPALVHGDLGGFGNWALSDVIAALRFVRDHAQLFGGDPENVTLVGESSGAMLVADLLGAPGARGLFRRVVLESGAVLVDDPQRAAGRAEELCRLLGLHGVDRSALERIPVEEIIAASGVLTDDLGGLLTMPFRPVVEPGMLPVHPAVAVADGAARGVDLLIGTNRDEFTLFTLGPPAAELAHEGGLELLVGRLLESLAPSRRDEAAEVVASYRGLPGYAERQCRPKQLLDAIATALAFEVPAARLSEVQSAYGRVFNYRFDWCSPFMNGVLGACHGLELPFVFGTLANPVIAVFSGGDDAAQRLAGEMQGAWGRFVEVGDPSGGALGRWPEYLPRRATMLLGERSAVADAPRDAERAMWEALLPRYGEDEVVASKSVPGT